MPAMSPATSYPANNRRRFPDIPSSQPSRLFHPNNPPHSKTLTIPPSSPTSTSMETPSITHKDVVKQHPETLTSPSNPSPHETIFLSNIDQAVTFSVETLFFFQIPPHEASSTLTISHTVKRSVIKTLIPYYFMAGRLQFNPETRRVELHCNNAGAQFIAATSNLTIQTLGDLRLPNSTFSHFVYRPGLNQTLDEAPLFTIQVTRFLCGGFSIGFMTNHSILDGKAASDMFQHIASSCRGKTLETRIINDRTCLRARNPPYIKFSHNEYIKIKETSSLPSSFTLPSQFSPSPLIFSKIYHHRLFNFSPEILKTLKSLSGMNCSTFEAIAAHLWRARTAALMMDRDERSIILFAVDVRARVSPTLPAGFAGNAVITAFAEADVWELEEKGLGFAVEKVREGKERVDDEYVRSAIDWLEIYKGIPATGGGAFYLSAWWKLSFAELDFGFGKPVYGGPVAAGNDEFVLLLGDGSGGGGINLWIGLEEEPMKRFSGNVYMI